MEGRSGERRGNKKRTGMKMKEGRRKNPEEKHKKRH